ncbi:MAG: adenine nucleotide alpha hydrolase [Bacteroidia bacterium]|nr:adenine nucleotide alpha hydrolase [Bacteroidia bacterium]
MEPPDNIRTYLNWSSGKDASMALHRLQQDGVTVEKLVTTVNKHFRRVSMHGLRIELLQRQSEALNIPLQLIELPEKPSMEVYDEIMSGAMSELNEQGFTHCGFGDIFLEDLRAYRENQLQKVGITASFPLWKQDTRQLINDFIQAGFKAVVVCLNASKLDNSFLGREIDEAFVKALPKGVDVCGEYGEFHTFCYDGPIFKNPVPFTLGEKTYREYEIKDANGDKNTVTGFWFVDLI